MRASSILRHAVLVVYLLIAIFPVFWLFNTSLKAPDSVFTPEFLGGFEVHWTNYARVVQSAFVDRLANSLILSLGAVVLTMVAGTLGGYAFARFPIRYKDRWFFAILTTRMAPSVAFGVPFYLLMFRLDLLNSYLGMILVYTFMNLALCVWLTRGFFEEVPIEIEEAALVDGCRPWRVFFTVTLPLVKAGLITTAVLVFIFTWNEFFFASVLTRRETMPYTVHLTTYFGSRRILWGELSAASILASVIPVAFAFFCRRYIVRGFSLGTVRTD